MEPFKFVGWVMRGLKYAALAGALYLGWTLWGKAEIQKYFATSRPESRQSV